MLATLASGHLVSAQTGPDATATVRGYFEALGHNDFQRALALTQGAAQERTASLVGTLRQPRTSCPAWRTMSSKRLSQ